MRRSLPRWEILTVSTGGCMVEISELNLSVALRFIEGEMVGSGEPRFQSLKMVLYDFFICGK